MSPELPKNLRKRSIGNEEIKIQPMRLEVKPTFGMLEHSPLLINNDPLISPIPKFNSTIKSDKSIKLIVEESKLLVKRKIKVKKWESTNDKNMKITPIIKNKILKSMTELKVAENMKNILF